VSRWVARIHVGGSPQAPAAELAHAILRAGLAASKADPLLRYGPASVSPLVPGPFGHFLEVAMTVHTGYCVTTYEGG
jgi:hypothetical protein